MNRHDNDNVKVVNEDPGIKRFLAALAIVLLIGILGSACAKEERKVPVTKLPERPASAEMPCEYLTDDEIISCIKDPSTRDVCRKVETNCARYDNLKDFVRRTWKARDGK